MVELTIDTDIDIDRRLQLAKHHQVTAGNSPIAAKLRAKGLACVR